MSSRARRVRPVAVVTDSTAGLPPELVAAHRLTVVPLSVTIAGVTGREGLDVAPADVAKALVARPVSVTTSRPSPGEFAAVYDRLLAEGAAAIVSVHLSSKLSGTCEAARVAAAGHPVRVAVVDSQSSGLGLGFCALAAAGAGALAAAVAAARAAVARTSTFFYVDTLEYLRRGGRIGAASALLGTALSVKPILRMVDGEIVVRDKVRTASRALTRLADLAVEAAGGAARATCPAGAAAGALGAGLVRPGAARGPATGRGRGARRPGRRVPRLAVPAARRAGTGRVQRVRGAGRHRPDRRGRTGPGRPSRPVPAAQRRPGGRRAGRGGWPAARRGPVLRQPGPQAQRRRADPGRGQRTAGAARRTGDEGQPEHG